MPATAPASKPLIRYLASVLVLMAGLLLAGPAFAHAALLSASPADDAVVATSPANLSLTFDEPVAPTVLSLIGPGGATLPLASPVLAGDTVAVPAPAALGNGTYALVWRVISADGHPVGGTLVFSIGAPSAVRPPTPGEGTDPAVAIAIWLARLLTYAGAFAGVGGVVFASWIGGRTGRWQVVALLAGLIALPADIALEGLDALGRPLGAILSPDIWRAGLAPGYATFVALITLAFFLALAAFRLPHRLARAASLLALLTLGASFAATGHAATAEPQWATRPAVFLHVLSVAIWIGALLPLAMLLRQDASAAAHALRRFSAAIPVAAAVLVLSGIGLAIVQVAAPVELPATSYGRVLLVKLGLVALLLALAAGNRWWLTRPALAGDTRASRRLVHVIGAELVLAALILGVVGLWRFTPPPRALLASAAVPVLAHLESVEGMATVTLSPGGAGPVAATIDVMLMDSATPRAKEVTLELGNEVRGIEPIERKATLGADGLWHVPGMVLPVAGTWQVEVDALVTDFRMVQLSGTIAVRP